MNVTLSQSDYFKGLSNDPIISSLAAYEGFDSNGGKCVEVSLHCTIHGKDKVNSNHFLSQHFGL